MRGPSCTVSGWWGFRQLPHMKVYSWRPGCERSTSKGAGRPIDRKGRRHQHAEGGTQGGQGHLPALNTEWTLTRFLATPSTSQIMLYLQVASSDADLSRTKLRSCEEQAEHAREQGVQVDAEVKDLRHTAQATAEDLQVCLLLCAAVAWWPQWSWILLMWSSMCNGCPS